jgi:hypothetical protein
MRSATPAEKSSRNSTARSTASSSSKHDPVHDWHVHAFGQEAGAPVVARMLGNHDDTATRSAADASSS